MTTITANETVERAADAIEYHGWTKWVTLDREGRMCIQGAIMYVLSGNADEMPEDMQPYHDAMQLVAEHVKGRLPYNAFSDTGTVCAWNNEVAQTKEEVISVLREVAAA